ncbi:MAG: polysaccharide deacetylase family protein [Tannerella sp.]|jgi:hypothetical protein|nr:polysaccharide deacetylase family protein [Tannerella sp.]
MVGEHLSSDVSRFVGYTSDVASFAKYKVVIIPSDFFDEKIYGTDRTRPSIPLKNIEGIPFLFGDSHIERIGETIVVHADLVASAYFLLSRYEELLLRHVRDEHGRFPGRESLPRRAGFIDRPVVDEYGKLIRRWLNQNGVKTEELVPFIRKINLTHDVDVPFSSRTWRNVVCRILSGQNPVAAIRDKYGPLIRDPYYTFPWMLQQNKMLQRTAGEERCQSLFFFRAGGKAREDRPRYNLNGKDLCALFELCREYEATVGLHSSYHSGMEPSLILSEKNNLENKFGIQVTHNRHHFLASREPEDMEYLEKAGITDDYTMGYADVAGFRLGTSLPVRYINPATKRLSSLMLHPLTIMDGTLNELKYMNLTADRAEEYCVRLIDHVRNVNGELTLLWHNTSAIEKSGYLRDLYSKLIKYLG